MGVVILAFCILIPGWEGLVLRLLGSALGIVFIVMAFASTVRVTVSPESFRVSYLIPLQVSYLLTRHRSRTVLWDDVFDLEFGKGIEDVYITLKSKNDHSRAGEVIRFHSGAVRNFDRLRSILEQRWENSKIKT